MSDASTFSTPHGPFYVSVDTCLHMFCLQVGGLTSAVCASAVPLSVTALMTCAIILSFTIVNNSSFVVVLVVAVAEELLTGCKKLLLLF
jgi:hypothetical protein